MSQHFQRVFDLTQRLIVRLDQILSALQEFRDRRRCALADAPHEFQDIVARFTLFKLWLGSWTVFLGSMIRMFSWNNRLLCRLRV